MSSIRAQVATTADPRQRTLAAYALLWDDLAARSRATTTTTVTADSDDAVLLVSSAAGAVTLNLPVAASVAGKLLFIKKTTTDVNTVTITPNGSETIDGAASLAIGAAGRDQRVIFSDGSNWHVVVAS